ncbi:hypothetical protein [Nocardia sp. BMG51109]|uniref:hypothetical protein n=1 Tax=Nocardia sp. BMG51109 TaxID=1056816 RepID=UPI001E6551AA|nr:hypothetical protein [Nocardia sp. BMG51109]
MTNDGQRGFETARESEPDVVSGGVGETPVGPDTAPGPASDAAATVTDAAQATPGAPDAESPEAAPDIGFALGAALQNARPASGSEFVEEQARRLVHEIARALAAAGPEGWQELVAQFAVTVSDAAVSIVYSDGGERALAIDPPEGVLDIVRAQREVSAQLASGPWWRMVLRMNAAGLMDADYDYGDEPFPEGQLLDPESYRVDLEAFPRQRLPVWLAAYIRHGDRQLRDPVRAAADGARRHAATRVDAVLPPLPVLWSRWAAVAAVYAALESPWGARVMPSLALFEGSSHSGSTLYLLPGDRAVLSGGVWDAPRLDAAYNTGADLPELYRGAPEWVVNPVLNARARDGLLSFCYWWSAGSWYCGEEPAPDGFDTAVPGVWSSEVTADVVCRAFPESSDPRLRSAAQDLVAAAEAFVVTDRTVAEVFEAGLPVREAPAEPGEGEPPSGATESAPPPREEELRQRIAVALSQLSLAGVVAEVPGRLSEEEAISRVADHLRASGLDTTNYPIAQLVAERVSAGWMVFVPVAPGEIAIGRALYYIADDGVIEESSSSEAPEVFIDGFEQRFQQRWSGTSESSHRTGE